MKPGKGTRDFLIGWIVPGGLVLAAALFPLDDPDTWWHLAAGRMILDGNFPVTNTFSHTFPDHPWRFTQWLFGVLIALAERGGGLVCVQLVGAILAVATFLFAIATVRRRIPEAHWSVVLPLFAIAVNAARFHFRPRGSLATLLGLSVIPYLWSLRPRRLPAYLFALGILWANLHAGFVFGLAVIALLGCAALLERDAASARHALVCGAAFFLGTLVNPGFLYPYRYLFENVQFSRHVPLSILELQSPRLVEVAPFPLLAAPAAGCLLHALWRGRYRDALLIAFSGSLSLSAARFIPFLSILALPGMVQAAQESREWIARKTRPLLSHAVFAFLALAAGITGHAQFRSDPPGFGANLRFYPAGAARYLEARGFSGKMFNSFDHGGFLIWRLYPRLKVFVDGRGNAYPWEHFRDTAAMDRRAIADVAGRFGIDFALVQRVQDIDEAPAFAEMGWEMVYLDGVSCVFVRPGSPDAARARGDAYRLLAPWKDPERLRLSTVEHPSGMWGEVRRVDPASIRWATDFVLLGSLAHHAGDDALSLRFLEEGLRVHPEDIEIRYGYAVVLASAGRIGEAAVQYRRITEADPLSELADRARGALGSVEMNRKNTR